MRQSREFLEKKEVSEELFEKKVNDIREAVDAILDRDGVVISVKQVTEQANQDSNREFKQWFARKTMREELHMSYKKLT